ncbi:toxin glutamine deamidase domain-containing protein [Catellatospora citrea]|uniref:WXG100-like domain-containing protein n=1 Tax=Catellatospora citrea TaxID=53366 RepID=UPI0033C52042
MSVLPSPIPNPMELLHVPSEVRPLLEWVIGADWPEGNEEIIWDLADEWFKAADRASGPLQDAAAYVTDAVSAAGGTQTQLGEAVKLSWDQLGATAESALPQLISILDVMGQVVEAAGQDIQAAKIEFWIELVLFVIEVIALIVAAFCTFGAASAGIPVLQMATQYTIRQIIKKLLKELAEKGMKELTKAALKKMIKEGAKEALEELVTETAIQSAQIADGHRDGLDGMAIGMSGVAGFAGGFAAAGVNLKLGPGGGFVRNMRNDVLAEVAGDVAGNLATGNVPGLDDVGMAATSGARSSMLGQGTSGLDNLTANINSQVQNLNQLAGSSQTLQTGLAADPSSTGGQPLGNQADTRGAPPSQQPAVTTSTSSGNTPHPSTTTSYGGGPAQGPSLSGIAPPVAAGFGIDATAAGPLRIDAATAVDATAPPPGQQAATVQQAATQQAAANVQAANQSAPGQQTAPAQSGSATGTSAGSATTTRGPASLAGMPTQATGGLTATAGTSVSASTSLPSPGTSTSPGLTTNVAGSTATNPGGITSASTDTRPSSPGTTPTTTTPASTSHTTAGATPASPTGTGLTASTTTTGSPSTGTPTTTGPSTGTPTTTGPSTGTPTTTSPSTGTPSTGSTSAGTPPTGSTPAATPSPGTPATATPATASPAPDGRTSTQPTGATPTTDSTQLSDKDAARLDRAARITAAMHWMSTHRDTLSPSNLGGRMVDMARVRLRAETSVQSLYSDRRADPNTDVEAGPDLRRRQQILTDALQATQDRDTPAPGGLDPAAQPTDGPPPGIEDSRQYGRPDGHTMPTVAQQRDLEASLPRNPDGSFRPHVAPDNGWGTTFDPVSPQDDPTRATACVDRALAFASTYAGLPRVAAGRTPTPDGSIPPPPPDGHLRIQQVLGTDFQQLTPDLRTLDPRLAAAAVTAGFDQLELSLSQPGAQGIVCFQRSDGTAHVINVINHEGEIRYYDGGTRLGRPPFTDGVTRMDGLALDPQLRPLSVADAPPGHWSPAPDRGSPAPATPGTTLPTAPDVPRYTRDDLTPTGQMDGRTQRRELMRGDDGFDHFPGDPVGTHRNDYGQLLDEDNHYYTDDNKLPPEGVAGSDLPNAVALPVDTTTEAGAAFAAGVTAHQQTSKQKETIWTTQVAPLIPQITAAGFTVDRNTFGSENQNTDEFRRAMTEVLSPAEMIALRQALADYQDICRQLVRASERLGLLAGDYVTEQLYQGSTLVTGGVDEPGRPATFDRVLVSAGDPPVVVIIEEKGAGAELGTRWVPDPANPTGPMINSQQTSPEYVRGVLAIDVYLQPVMEGNPDLARTMHGLLTAGQLECLVVRGRPDGRIMVQTATLDPDRLRADSIRLVGYEPEEQQ